eukprot:COSAG01_NODE_2076_length_8486_cov_41.323000_7_plen_74_part_00
MLRFAPPSLCSVLIDCCLLADDLAFIRQRRKKEQERSRMKRTEEKTFMDSQHPGRPVVRCGTVVTHVLCYILS